jgi:hypothetical protein
MFDTVEVIIILLSALAVAVWAHSWILDSRGSEGPENQPEESTSRLYHGKAMLGVEEF